MRKFINNYIEFKLNEDLDYKGYFENLNGKTPYEILGIDKKSSVEDIRKAWKQKVKETHSDAQKGESKYTFLQVDAAYKILTDETMKDMYDNKKSTQSSSSSYSKNVSDDFKPVINKAKIIVDTGGNIFDSMLREPSKKWFDKFKSEYIDFYMKTIMLINNEGNLRMQMARQANFEKVLLDLKGGINPLVYDLRLIYDFKSAEFIVKFGYTNPLMVRVFDSLMDGTLEYTTNSLKNLFSRGWLNTKFYTLTKEYKIK